MLQIIDALKFSSSKSLINDVPKLNLLNKDLLRSVLLNLKVFKYYRLLLLLLFFFYFSRSRDQCFFDSPDINTITK